MSTSEKVTSPNPVCSIVLRAFNEEKHIGRLLSGILEQKMSAIEIILVDSGSTDATLAIASRYPVRVLSITPEEFTFGRSLNIGCSAAQGEFIVLASAHVYPVYSDWLERLLAPFEDEKVALVYGKQRGNKTTRFSEHQIKYTRSGSLRLRNPTRSLRFAIKQTRLSAAPCGRCGLMMKNCPAWRISTGQRGDPPLTVADAAL